MRRSVAFLLLALTLAPGPLPSQVGAQATDDVQGGRYRLSGEQGLRPVRIHDDGLRTYIEWSEEQMLPAVFAIGPLGREESVNGYMREGIFTLDRIDRVLVFRIDRKVARATRLPRSAAR